MKIKMDFRGGGFLIPTKYRAPTYSDMNQIGIFIQVEIGQITNILRNHRLKRRWNKLNVETPTSLVFTELYSRGQNDEILTYKSSDCTTEIVLDCDLIHGTCFISQLSERSF